MSWSKNSSMALNVYTDIAVSSDGMIQTAVGSYCLYNSSDCGITWEKNNSIASYFNSLPSTNKSIISAITMSASGKEQVICLYDGGILYSLDSGITWNVSNALINKWVDIKMAPDALILFAVADEGGIYSSFDNGITWQLANYTLISCKRICFNNAKYENNILTIHLYVTTYDGIYYSNDGINFNNVYNYGNDFCGIAISNSLPVENSIIACTHVNYGNFVLSISFDNGITWNMQTISENQQQTGLLNNVAMSSDGTTIYFSDKNANSFIGRLYFDNFDNIYNINPLGGLPIIPNPLQIGGLPSYLFAMNNDGLIVITIRNNLYNLVNQENFVVNNNLPTFIYTPWFNNTMNSNGDLQLVCNMKGLYISNDYGNSWNLNSNAPTQVFSVSMDNTGEHMILFRITDRDALYYETFGVGDIWYSNDFGETWVISDFTNKYVSNMCTTSDGTFMMCCSTDGIYTSTNYGQTWVFDDMNYTDFLLHQEFNYNLVSTFAMDKTGTYICIVIANVGVYVTTDRGLTWNRTLDGNILLLDMDDTANYITAVSDSGFVYYSNDKGNTFILSDSPIAMWNNDDAGISIAVSGNGMIQYISISNNIYISFDGGKTWYLDTSISNEPIVSIAINNDGLYTTLLSFNNIYTYNYMYLPTLELWMYLWNKKNQEEK